MLYAWRSALTVQESNRATGVKTSSTLGLSVIADTSGDSVYNATEQCPGNRPGPRSDESLEGGLCAGKVDHRYSLDDLKSRLESLLVPTEASQDRRDRQASNSSSAGHVSEMSSRDTADPSSFCRSAASTLHEQEYDSFRLDYLRSSTPKPSFSGTSCPFSAISRLWQTEGETSEGSASTQVQTISGTGHGTSGAGSIWRPSAR